MIVVRVTPANDMRRAFAEWAVEQVPKVRTISSRSFAVPPDQFTGLPEYLLIGAMVDGHQYVPVPEDEQEPEQAAVLPVRECPAKCAATCRCLAEAYCLTPCSSTGRRGPGQGPPAGPRPAPHPPPSGDGRTGQHAGGGRRRSPRPGPAVRRIFDTPRGLATHCRQHTETED